MTNLHREPICDLGVTWNGRFGVSGKIDENGVTTSFAFKTATISLKMGD